MLGSVCPDAVALLCRIGLCFVAIFVLWDIKSVFYLIWKPFDWLVGYTDPRKGPQDRLHGELEGEVCWIPFGAHHCVSQA